MKGLGPSLRPQDLRLPCFSTGTSTVWRSKQPYWPFRPTMDNVSAAHYRQGSTHAQTLLDLIFVFYHLIVEIPLEVRAPHILGFSCHSQSAPMEQQLYPDVFQMICLTFRKPNVDLFATCYNHQLQTFVSS